jgi:hypothetical protein
MGGEAPDADGPAEGPGFAAVAGLGWEGFAFVGGVVVANVGEQAAVGGFDGVEFVVVFGVIAGAGGDGAEPWPGAAIGKEDGAVRVGERNAVGGEPGEAAIGGARSIQAPGRDWRWAGVLARWTACQRARRAGSQLPLASASARSGW